MLAPALSFVIPLFYSAETIAAVVREIESFVIPGGHEIVLVNDGNAISTAGSNGNNWLNLAAGVSLLGFSVHAQDAAPALKAPLPAPPWSTAGEETPKAGKPATAADIAAYDIDASPNGADRKSTRLNSSH